MTNTTNTKDHRQKTKGKVRKTQNIDKANRETQKTRNKDKDKDKDKGKKQAENTPNNRTNKKQHPQNRTLWNTENGVVRESE